MNVQELQKIEQRLKEGYYEADPETLQTMRELVEAVRGLREQAEPAQSAELL